MWDSLDPAVIFDVFGDAIVATGDGERILYANRALANLVGRPVSDLVGQPVRSLFPPRADADLARAGRDPSAAVCLPLLGDGGEIEVELKHALVQVGGTTVGFSVMRERQARPEDERTRLAMRYLRAAAELASRITGHHDLGAVLEDVTATLLGELAAECAWVALLLPDGRPVVRTTRKAPGCRDLAFDAAAILARTAESRASHVDTAQGIAAFPLIVRADLVGVMLVSTREALAGALLESLSTVAALAATAINDAAVLAAHLQAIRLRDDFLAVAGHELRTPLSALLMQVESVVVGVRRGAFPHERVVERLGKVERHADRLAALINQLLDISRLADGRLQLERESFDLREVVEDVADRHAGPLQTSGSRLELHIESVVGQWDRMRLDQLVSNLLGNAIKYGSGKPIALALKAREQSAILEVRDQGIGMAIEDQGRVFGRFERAVSSSSYAGLGLGLWLVKKIVEEHGGIVELESAVDEGTTLRVELPRSPS